MKEILPTAKSNKGEAIVIKKPADAANDGARRASSGREFHKREATSEKALP